ncbi:unnamed protein product [Acanthoscelides obtectus]|uniref:Uncharacterized protein n=1 Tax=Acanthoscelides obtectus TaxID=200917 RepID=A0A9P0KSY7_ACAOB|nr:unnamed protein product [Acanthoscelides obtectus]CAK1676232.1 hypothetical protein AOBTE_LOCUS30660 [Acanthoscelides obtectus]
MFIEGGSEKRACAHAGFIAPAAPALALHAAPTAYSVATPAALTSQSSNIYRSFGNLGQVSTYHKTVDTPFSSVSKSDVRVSNPGVRFAAPALAAYAAPTAYAAHAAYAAPTAYAAHAAYAAPTAYTAHAAYAAPTAYTAHAAYAAPAISAHAAYAAPAAVAHGPLLGVAYSAAPAVSHITYASGYANYAF